MHNKRKISRLTIGASYQREEDIKWTRRPSARSRNSYETKDFHRVQYDWMGWIRNRNDRKRSRLGTEASKPSRPIRAPKIGIARILSKTLTAESEYLHARSGGLDGAGALHFSVVSSCL